jgi:hypothetical protein
VNRLYCAGNDQASEENSHEPYQYGDDSPGAGLDGNIAVADRKPCDEREVEGVSKRNLLRVGDARGAEQNPDKHQGNDGSKTPHDSEKIGCGMEQVAHSLF